MSAVAERLMAEGVRLKRWTAGTTEKIICTQCHGGRTREASLNVTIDADGEGATMICHRGQCGWRHGFRTAGKVDLPRSVRAATAPAPHSEAQVTNRPEWLYDWFDGRKIGAKTVDMFGVYAAERFFGEKLGRLPSIVFPYRFSGEVVNRKYRPHPAKTPQLQEKDALPTLFNVDALGEAPTEIVFAEGEPDVMALWECGIKNAVSLKDGAPKEAGDGCHRPGLCQRQTHPHGYGFVRARQRL